MNPNLPPSKGPQAQERPASPPGKIGRNAPCYCGSGKKYKRCHLPVDERAIPTVLPRPDADTDIASPTPFPETAPPARNAAELLSLFREIRGKSGKLSGKKRSEFEKLIAPVAPVIDYLERESEIHAATLKLEAHREEFSRFLQDQAGLRERSEALFAEEPFRHLWFTADEIGRAFDKTGYQASSSDPEKFAKTVFDAILHLADADRRKRLAFGLLSELPPLVEKGRYLDGWLVQYVATLTLNCQNESNPFLFEMFCHGYEVWQRKQQSFMESFCRELDLDPARLQEMSLEEVSAALAKVDTDPAKKARVEAAFKTCPEQQTLATAELERVKQECLQLLERDEARALLLSLEDLEPYWPMLQECFKKLSQVSNPGSGTPMTPEQRESAGQLLRPVLSQIAKSHFTPERLERLQTYLRQYPSGPFAAKSPEEKGTARLAFGALNLLRNDHGRDYFLTNLIFRSLLALEPPKGGEDTEQQVPIAPASAD